MNFVHYAFLVAIGICVLLPTDVSAQHSTYRPAEWAQPIGLAGVPNLYRVSDDLYRSAQPSTVGMRSLKSLGIVTVINLRLLDSDRRKIGLTGFAQRQIRVRAGAPQRNEAVCFLKVVTEKSHGPYLVHCQHGADRTGAMIAIYRIGVQGWPKEEAIREMRCGGYGFHEQYANLARWIRGLDVDSLCRDAGIQPARVRTGPR